MLGAGKLSSILHLYRGRFASYLLPFNYAFGISGGIDMITTTLRLGIEKYMTGPESRGELPTRSLISLDIRNMFNAVSRQKLREIVSIDFPELLPLADCLYDGPGKTVVKRSDGTWEAIPVREGFSQGCPLSPIFAAIVLKRILTKIHRDLMVRVQERLSEDMPKFLDDGRGGQPLILGYVDDVNVLVPTRDVHTFLKLFKKYGEPYGAVLNTEKTRILTNTGGVDIPNKLKNSWISEDREIGKDLFQAIKDFSKNKDGSPLEVTDGLRVLGVPIGSQRYCNSFIMKMMTKAVAESNAIRNGLDSDQTILQLFRTCTANKMTHLFAADVINADYDALPEHWNIWRSEMASAFSKM